MSPPRMNKLPVAAAKTTNVKELPSLETSFPSSKKITLGTELQVPMREIHLSNDDEPVRIYDTIRPQDYSPRDGLPKRRQE